MSDEVEEPSFADTVIETFDQALADAYMEGVKAGIEAAASWLDEDGKWGRSLSKFVRAIDPATVKP